MPVYIYWDGGSITPYLSHTHTTMSVSDKHPLKGEPSHSCPMNLTDKQTTPSGSYPSLPLQNQLKGSFPN
jgi:hypothetical protein